MSDAGIFSFHLATVPVRKSTRLLLRSPRRQQVPGLRYAECLSLMRLGAPTISPDRLQLRQFAMFARWDDDNALERFLAGQGAALADGWHVRMEYLRRWSSLTALDDLPARAHGSDDDEPVVAVTVARLRLPELPRFLDWGKPVERMVRDHPHTTLALAAVRLPRTISTFSIWESIRSMTDMVHGRSSASDVPDPQRHAAAMGERRRRDFHREFATFRFRPLSEHGVWNGRGDYLPSALR